MAELISKSNVQNLLDKLNNLKADAYANLDQALAVDNMIVADKATNNNLDNLIVLYEKSLMLLEKALEFYQKNKTELSHREDAKKTNSNLEKMKSETIERLSKIKEKRFAAAASKIQPISNDDFLNISDDILNADDDCIIIDDDLVRENGENTDCIIIDGDDDKHSNSNKLNDSLHKNDFSKATELLHIDNGVQLFYIATDGTVSTPSNPATLSVYSFNEEVIEQYRKKGSNVVGFVRVDSWMYPLVPNESPGMKTNFNAYIFPNQDPNLTFVGITFANKSNQEGINFFEDVLANYGSLIYQDKNETSGIKRPQLNPSSTLATQSMAKLPQVNDEGEKINEAEKNKIKENEETKQQSTLSAEGVAQSVLNGAQYLTKGISATADYANKYINVGGVKIKNNLKPNEEPMKVDSNVQSLVRNVRYGTHVSVRVSSFVLNKLGAFAKYTAKAVAPHIKEGSTQLLAKTGVVGDKTSAVSYVDGFCTVAGSSVEGFGMVYDSLEEAAKCLAKNVTEQTVTVVDHKYGADAAKLTQNSMHSIGNVALTVNNFKNIKVIRTVAKETAKQAIMSKPKESNSIQATNDDAKNIKKGNESLNKS